MYFFYKESFVLQIFHYICTHYGKEKRTKFLLYCAPKVIAQK